MLLRREMSIDQCDMIDKNVGVVWRYAKVREYAMGTGRTGIGKKKGKATGGR